MTALSAFQDVSTIESSTIPIVLTYTKNASIKRIEKLSFKSYKLNLKNYDKLNENLHVGSKI